jgi:hypothetical protein
MAEEFERHCTTDMIGWWMYNDTLYALELDGPQTPWEVGDLPPYWQWVLRWLSTFIAPREPISPEELAHLN